MMNSEYGASTCERNLVGYSTVESLLDEAASNLRRYSRGSASGQKTSGSIGSSMRIVKPNSASNSPRGSMGLGRRKTVTDRRRVPVPSGFISHDGLQIPTRSNRPLSWHPSSQFAPQQVYQTVYPATNTRDDFQPFELPPTPAVYSGYTSPDSTFSPLSMPYTGYEQQQYTYPNSSNAFSSNSNYGDRQEQFGGHHIPSYLSTSTENTDSAIYSHFDWNSFANNGFENTTAPPTPDNFIPIQYPDPSFPAEEAIPYHPLSDSTDEEEGEILCGMGLYDEPEIGKALSFDPQLDNYRTSMSQLLGPSHRREPTGKGLKLEETWNPPTSDDEEEDGEGEDDDDAVVEPVEYNAEMKDIALISTQPIETDFEARNRDRISWL